MLRLLGLVIAALAAASGLLFLSAGQAFANHVQCGDAIAQDTTLDSDLLGCSGGGLTITGPDVVLDLNGHTVDGGIYGNGLKQIDDHTWAASPRAVVENGTVKNGGVFLIDYNHETVQNLRTDGIDAERGRKLIQDNVVNPTGSSSFGIFCDRGGGQISNNFVMGLVELSFACNAVVTGNLVKGGHIYSLVSSPTLIGNTIRHGGIALQIGGLTAIQNTIADSGGDGVKLTDIESSTTLQENVIVRSGGDGIDINTYGESSATITGNRTWSNSDLGINAGPGVIDGGGNWAKHNGNPLQCLNVSCTTTGRPR